MDGIDSLLSRAEGLGIKLWAEGGELRFRCRREGMPAALLTELRERKPALLDYLQRQQQGPVTAQNERPVLRVMPACVAVPALRQATWHGVKTGGLGVGSANGTHHVFQIPGRIDADQLERGVQALIERHPVLCTRVLEVEGRPWLYYDADRPRLERYDLSGYDESSRSIEATRLASARVWETFDLSRGPLFRVFLISCGPAEHVFGFVMHHLISDGISVGIVSSELTVLCGVRNAILFEDSKRVQYRDYLLCMTEWLNTAAAESQFQFWEDRLDGAKQLALRRTVDRTVLTTTTQEVLDIDAELTARIRNAARNLRTSVFVFLVAVQKVMCTLLTGENDITLGAVTTGRDAPVLEPVIGYFADRVLYRSSLAGNPTFAQIVERERSTVVEAVPYQFARFDILRQRLVQLDRMIVMPFFNFIPAGAGSVRRPAGWAPFQINAAPVNTTPKLYSDWLYWMALQESATDIRGRVRFNGHPIPGLVRNFKHILSTAVASEERRLADFSLLPSR